MEHFQRYDFRGGGGEGRANHSCRHHHPGDQQGILRSDAVNNPRRAEHNDGVTYFSRGGGETKGAGARFRGREERFEEGGELLIENVIHAGHADNIQNKHPHLTLAEHAHRRF